VKLAREEAVVMAGPLLETGSAFPAASQAERLLEADGI
jgi:hypothetical protein